MKHIVLLAPVNQQYAQVPKGPGSVLALADFCKTSAGPAAGIPEVLQLLASVALLHYFAA